ncbi:MAG: SDR family oxidoreductase [bacterium]
MSQVFVTGGTGYLGRPLIKQLIERGHVVQVLARQQSVGKVPSGAAVVTGNALDASSFASSILPAETLVHLIGVPHPNPRKAEEFRTIDLASIKASVIAARQAGVRHFVYVSVAHPAPVMQQYVAVREQGEALIEDSGISASILRPWYVLGPGHRWPYMLLPVYKLFEWFPPTRTTARRLGLVTLRQMVTALTSVVESPPTGVRILEVPDIRSAELQAKPA